MPLLWDSFCVLFLSSIVSCPVLYYYTYATQCVGERETQVCHVNSKLGCKGMHNGVVWYVVIFCALCYTTRLLSVCCTVCVGERERQVCHVNSGYSDPSYCKRQFRPHFSTWSTYCNLTVVTQNFLVFIVQFLFDNFIHSRTNC